MPNVGGIKNVKALLEKLDARRKKSLRDDSGTVVVGYNTKYAVRVHEMIEKHAGKPRTGYHPPGKKKGGAKKKGNWWDPAGRGQPKYLEQPARDLNNSGELAREIREAYDKGKQLQVALAAGALRIQRESQKLVPVDLAKLKGSAFVEKEL